MRTAGNPDGGAPSVVFRPSSSASSPASNVVESGRSASRRSVDARRCSRASAVAPGVDVSRAHRSFGGPPARHGGANQSQARDVRSVARGGRRAERTSPRRDCRPSTPEVERTRRRTHPLIGHHRVPLSVTDCQKTRRYRGRPRGTTSTPNRTRPAPGVVASSQVRERKRSHRCVGSAVDEASPGVGERESARRYAPNESVEFRRNGVRAFEYPASGGVERTVVSAA